MDNSDAWTRVTRGVNEIDEIVSRLSTFDQKHASRIIMTIPPQTSTHLLSQISIQADNPNADNDEILKTRLWGLLGTNKRQILNCVGTMVICGHKADSKKIFWESTELRNDFNHDFPNQAYDFKIVHLKK